MEAQRKIYDAKLDEIRSRQVEQGETVDTEQMANRLERELTSLAIRSAMDGAS